MNPSLLSFPIQVVTLPILFSISPASHPGLDYVVFLTVLFPKPPPIVIAPLAPRKSLQSSKPVPIPPLVGKHLPLILAIFTLPEGQNLVVLQKPSIIANLYGDFSWLGSGWSTLCSLRRPAQATLRVRSLIQKVFAKLGAEVPRGYPVAWASERPTRWGEIPKNGG